MSDTRLTKEKAFRLISAVVDDEVDHKTKTAFYNFIETDEEVRREYESIKKVKRLVTDRCPTHKAPDRLKIRVQEFLLQEINQDREITSQEDPNISDIDLPVQMPEENFERESQDSGDKSEADSFRWFYAAAAAFLALAILWGILYRDSSPPAQLASNTYEVEEYVYKHFENNDGQLVPPTIRTASLSDAELSISSNYNMTMKVPSLKKSEFMGVVYSEFVPDFKTPLLEYYIPDEDQYIYIFAFPVDHLNKHGKLTRDQEAVKSCVKPSDFHIENVNGKHVVSWRWDNTWYSAISNHNGEILASLVEDLQHTVDSNN